MRRERRRSRDRPNSMNIQFLRKKNNLEWNRNSLRARIRKHRQPHNQMAYNIETFDLSKKRVTYVRHTRMFDISQMLKILFVFLLPSCACTSLARTNANRFNIITVCCDLQLHPKCIFSMCEFIIIISRDLSSLSLLGRQQKQNTNKNVCEF